MFICQNSTRSKLQYYKLEVDYEQVTREIEAYQCWSPTAMTICFILIIRINDQNVKSTSALYIGTQMKTNIH